MILFVSSRFQSGAHQYPLPLPLRPSLFLGTNTLRAKATFSLCEQACGKFFLQLRLKAKGCGGGYVKGGGGVQQSILWGNVKMANCLSNLGVKMGTSGK